MKKETVEQKFNRMLGIKDEVVQEIKAKTTGRVVGISEEEIQNFRAAQGLLYFFKAPELFSYKICPHCKEDFFVSRKYVAYCSYTCISKSLEEVTGVEWRKGQDIEGLVLSPIYEGNEPIWLTGRLLKKLQEMVSTLPSNLDENALPQQLDVEIFTELPPVESVSKSDALAALGLGPTSKSSTRKSSSSSSVSTTTTTTPTGTKTTSPNKGKSRRIISGP